MGPTTIQINSWATPRGLSAVTSRTVRVAVVTHTFPPPLAPSLSFVGVPMQIFAPWFFQAQARWVALVLSSRAALPLEEEMLRAVREDSSAREAAGVPAYRTHAIPAVDRYVRH